MTVAFHDPLWVHKKMAQIAKGLGWKRKLLCTVTRSLPVEAFYSPPCSVRSTAVKRVYISAGIHGDEPAGVLALIQWLENFRPSLLFSYHFTLIPLINPWGLKHNSRLNEHGVDLNRSFQNVNLSPIKEIRSFLEAQQPFDLCLLLHEDYDAHGIYLYEIPSNLQLGRKILDEVSKTFLIDSRPKIEGRKHNGGVLSRPLQKSRFEKIGYPEAVYLYFQFKCKRIYTIETPSEWDIEKRIKAHTQVIDTALSLIAEETTDHALEDNHALSSPKPH
ncbi:M14 family metallopeptidase [Methylacidiphilum caldifontis]|nr:M14 family metallocarboxypeptidase [Methylacidiphilum caldifontis]